MLQGREDKFNLAGDKLLELKNRSGRPVVADGFVKMPGQFEVTRFIDQKPNTMELFVMSQCPFGQRAETMLYDFLDRTNESGGTGHWPVPSGDSPDGTGRTLQNKNDAPSQPGRLALPVGGSPTRAGGSPAPPGFKAKPKLEVHYTFYKQSKDGKDAFVSMHGDGEVTEDLVQMMIRDHFPSATFESYLRLRNKSGNTEWQKLAGKPA